MHKQRSESSASLRGSGSAEAMVSAVGGLPATLNPGVQIETSPSYTVLRESPRPQNLATRTLTKHLPSGLRSSTVFGYRWGRLVGLRLKLSLGASKIEGYSRRLSDVRAQPDSAR